MTDSTQHPETSRPPEDTETRPLGTTSPASGTTADPATLAAEQARAERLHTAQPADARPAAPTPRADPRPPARMSTIVWGLIIVVVGAGVVARALGADFDNQLALIVLLAAAGVALVVTSIVSAVRRR